MGTFLVRIATVIGVIFLFASPLYAALNFNADTDVVNFGDNYDFERTDKFTIEFWFTSSAAAAGRGFVGKITDSNEFRGYMLDTFGTGNVLRVFMANDNAVPDRIIVNGSTAYTSLFNGQWHHIAWTYSGSSTAAGHLLYVDGVAETMTTIADTLTATTVNVKNLSIGNIVAVGYTGVSIGGSMDEFRVWNYVRTADLISGNRFRRISDEEGLIGYWRLDEGVGVTNAVRPFGSHASSTSVFGTLTSVDWVDSAAINYAE